MELTTVLQLAKYADIHLQIKEENKGCKLTKLAAQIGIHLKLEFKNKDKT